MTAQDLANDSHLRERGYLWEFPNPQAPAVGSRIFAGRPFRDPVNPMSIEKVAKLGQDNGAILAELAGLSPVEIGELESEGVVYGEPRPDETEAVIHAPRQHELSRRTPILAFVAKQLWFLLPAGSEVIPSRPNEPTL